MGRFVILCPDIRRAGRIKCGAYKRPIFERIALGAGRFVRPVGVTFRFRIPPNSDGYRLLEMRGRFGNHMLSGRSAIECADDGRKERQRTGKQDKREKMDV